jgi:hypothetical protein
MDLFSQQSRPDPQRVASIKAWVAGQFELSEDAVVMVSELRCTEPGCPPLETVIAIIDGPGARRQAKLHKPVSAIELPDIAALRFHL